MLNRGLPANLSGLTSTNGLQPRGTVTCVAGNECSLASRTTGFAALQAQANRGDPVNFQMSLERAIPKDCFQCAEHAEWHTKHVHCTMEVGGNSGILKGPAFEACKAGVDIEALATLVKNDISGIISGIANNPSTVPDVTGGASIATNHTTVHFTSCPNPASGCPETGPMACEQPDLISSNGAHVAVVPCDRVTGNALYFELLVPKTLLDDTPMSAGAIFNVPAAHNIGPNEGRLHPDLRTAAKAADPLQSLKFAAYGFAAGCGGPGFLDRAIS